MGVPSQDSFPLMTRLHRLLHPRSIAIVGGGAFATNVVKQSLKMGFTGHIWPIHPTKPDIEGIPACRSIADLPAPPDAAFIGVNRFATIDILRELAARKAGGAISFAAGFLEADDPDGPRLQRELIEAAGDMPVIGPNCYGLINYADGALLWPDQHGGRRLAPGTRGAAIITQSSNIACNLTMQKRGLPLAFLMTAGNQAQTGLSEMALGLIEDERVSVLGLHIEGFDSIPGFERLAARARELKKPIVAMKVGRSEQARAATISHTASLAGSDAGSEVFIKRLGIARVHSIPAFLETLKLLHGVGPLAGNRLSSMSCSGGEASVMADAADGRAVTFPPLGETHRNRVKATLGPLVAVANPLDYHTFIWNDEPAMTATFTAMVSGGFDLNMLVLDFPRTDRCSDADWWPTVRAFEAALKASDARGAIVASIAENLPEEHADDLFARGIVPLHGIEEAIATAEAAAFVGQAWRNLSSTPKVGRGGPAMPGRSGGEASAHNPHSASLSSAPLPLKGGEERRPLDEASAKSLLASRNLPVPLGRRVSCPKEAVTTAQSLGLPVALKSLGLAHKSEHGAVRLNLHTPAEIEAAAAALLPLGTGLYVERMIENAVAELIVGISPDPVFGTLLTIGSGGVLVELLADTATLLVPAPRDEIETALRSLKLFPLLDGYRGRPKGDIKAAIDTILAICDFVVDNEGRIVELDINPLIVCERGAFIADALLVGDFEILEKTA